ncbi:MAG: DUF1007 family protein [Spirochaetales bacterium]|nr:DUF1007 family protein [Spirochaetales bacterium]
MKPVTAALALLTVTAGLAAHPHTFINTRLELTFTETEFNGFWIDWEFDPVFTDMIAEYYDSNGDGSYSAAETQEVYKDAFSNLANYHYFTRVFQNGREYPTETVKDFSVYIHNGLLHYRFFVAHTADIPAPGRKETLNIAIFDETYFCAVDYFNDTPVTVQKPETVHVAYTFEENVKRRIEYPTNDATAAMGITYPTELVVTFSIKE